MTYGPTESASATVRISDLVSPRKIPPAAGWRKVPHTGSLRMVNPGESPGERHCRELGERIGRYIRRQYVIAFISGKGGVGTTTMAACLGAAFAESRTDSVVAVDAAPGLGARADLTERFGLCGLAVEFMPHDAHLAQCGIIDVRNQLTKESRLRLFEITAALADKYVPDSERSRR